MLRLAGASGGKNALRHNKRMHATADTTVVIYLQRRGAARDAQRYAAIYKL
jgi:hypothetical protein